MFQMWFFFWVLKMLCYKIFCRTNINIVKIDIKKITNQVMKLYFIGNIYISELILNRMTQN